MSKATKTATVTGAGLGLALAIIGVTLGLKPVILGGVALMCGAAAGAGVAWEGL